MQVRSAVSMSKCGALARCSYQAIISSSTEQKNTNLLSVIYVVLAVGSPLTVESHPGELLSRHIGPLLEEALTFARVVNLVGPRQAGKPCWCVICLWRAAISR